MCIVCGIIELWSGLAEKWVYVGNIRDEEKTSNSGFD
jgi:hypothetical protein